jgi:hypothetical protein
MALINHSNKIKVVNALPKCNSADRSQGSLPCNDRSRHRVPETLFRPTRAATSAAMLSTESSITVAHATLSQQLLQRQKQRLRKRAHVTYIQLAIRQFETVDSARSGMV